jgi:uncharacterized membrane protein (UPF0127 family)
MKFFANLALFFILSLFNIGAIAAENSITIDKNATNAAIEKVFTSDINAPATNVSPLTKKIVDKSAIKAASTPIFYTRDKIKIWRKSPPKPPTPLPWKKNDAPEKPEIDNTIIVLDVEIRDGMSLYNQSGWFNLSSLSDNTGVMMAFGEPAIQPIINSAQYAPVDILFVDKQGKIAQIVPNILLSELEQEIHPKSPILAFLFLKGGACAELSINAGDEIEYYLFKKPPLILNAPNVSETEKL